MKPLTEEYVDWVEANIRGGEGLGWSGRNGLEEGIAWRFGLSSAEAAARKYDDILHRLGVPQTIQPSFQVKMRDEVLKGVSDEELMATLATDEAFRAAAQGELERRKRLRAGSK